MYSVNTDSSMRQRSSFANMKENEPFGRIFVFWHQIILQKNSMSIAHERIEGRLE